MSKSEIVVVIIIVLFTLAFLSFFAIALTEITKPVDRSYWDVCLENDYTDVIKTEKAIYCIRPNTGEVINVLELQ